jgi:hypothetical protein
MIERRPNYFDLEDPASLGRLGEPNLALRRFEASSLVSAADG